MKSPRKSSEEAQSLGSQLRTKRKLLGLSLEAIAEKIAVDVGQLSRFERGDFVFLSQNLQIFFEFLQKQGEPAGRQPKLVERFAAVLGKSERHSAAAGALVSALETLE